jgi:hypothetical protein
MLAGAMNAFKISQLAPEPESPRQPCASTRSFEHVWLQMWLSGRLRATATQFACIC